MGRLIFLLWKLKRSMEEQKQRDAVSFREGVEFSLQGQSYNVKPLSATVVAVGIPCSHHSDKSGKISAFPKLGVCLIWGLVVYEKI